MKKLKSLSSVANDIKYELFTYGDAAEGDIDYTSIFKISFAGFGYKLTSMLFSVKSDDDKVLLVYKLVTSALLKA